MEYAELIKKISKLPEYAKKLEEVVEQIKIAVDLVINSAKNITDIASNIAKNIFNFVNYLWKTLSNIVASFFSERGSFDERIAKINLEKNLLKDAKNRAVKDLISDNPYLSSHCCYPWISFFGSKEISQKVKVHQNLYELSLARLDAQENKLIADYCKYKKQV